MIRSHRAHAALCAVLALTLAGCLENSYRSRAGNVVVVSERAPAVDPGVGSTSAPRDAEAARAPSEDAPAVAHQGPAASERYAVPGFVVLGHDGRLWVFKRGSAAYALFESKGEPAKRVTLIGAGPDGKTLLGADKQVMQDFADSHKYTAPGFVTIAEDGRLWVFRAGSPHLASFIEKGEPAKRVTLIGTGPEGKTLLGSDKEAMQAYAAAVANGG